MNEFSDIAQRHANAFNHLMQTLKDAADLTDGEARHAAAYYLEHKLAKLDNIGGSSSVKHGAFLARDVVRRSLEFSKDRARKPLSWATSACCTTCGRIECSCP